MSGADAASGGGISGDAIGLDGFADLEPIGSGGFADVYRAWDPQLQRHVAVKVLRVTKLDDEVVERFSTETRAMGAISSSESIVSLYKSGFTTGGRPFLVMEYCGGGSASAALKELANSPEGPGMAVERVVEIGLVVADGLLQAHRHGIVHGDVKPSNILFGTYSPKLTDFGIAAFTHDHAEAAPIGVSYQFAAPEVLRWEPVTTASDLYSLGATLYVLVGGKVPFPAENTESVLRKVRQEPPPPLIRPGLPSGLTELIDDLMSKDPADRPRDAADVIDRLRRLQVADPSDLTVDLRHVEGLPVVGAPPRVEPTPAAEPPPLAVSTVGDPPVGRPAEPDSAADSPDADRSEVDADGPGSINRLVVAIVALVVIIGAATWWLGRGNDEAPTDAEIVRSVVPLLSPAVSADDGPRIEPLAPHRLEVVVDGEGRATLRWSIEGDVLGFVIAASVFPAGPVAPDAKPTSSGYLTADGALASRDTPLLRVPADSRRATFSVDVSHYTCLSVVSLVDRGLVASEEQVCLPLHAPDPPERPSVDVAAGRATISWSPVDAASGYAVIEVVDDGGEKVVEQVVIDDGVRSATLPHHEGAGYVVVALNAVNAEEYPRAELPTDRSGWSEPNVP